MMTPMEPKLIESVQAGFTHVFRMWGFWWLLVAPLLDLSIHVFGVSVATYWHLAYHDNDDLGLRLTRVTLLTIALVAAALLDLALQALLNRFSTVEGSANVA